MVTVKATVIPDSGLSSASYTAATGVIGTAEPTMTCWPSPATTASRAGAPEKTVTVGNVEVTGAPSMELPIVVAVPAATAENVAEYVPSPLSLVVLICPLLLPPEDVNVTVRPPDVMALPY